MNSHGKLRSAPVQKTVNLILLKSQAFPRNGYSVQAAQSPL